MSSYMLSYIHMITLYWPDFISKVAIIFRRSPTLRNLNSIGLKVGRGNIHTYIRKGKGVGEGKEEKERERSRVSRV